MSLGELAATQHFGFAQDEGGMHGHCRDNSGNWLVLVEPSNEPVTADDFK
ncbi:MAG TPA: hypothetical protein VL769_08225 [Acidimicrobiia bacterium]|nr:hypothetical protein [Acidimicrobiia bacterium]